MGYTQSTNPEFSYVASDLLIGNNDPEVFNGEAAYTLMKEFIVIHDIFHDSTFRISFDLKAAVGTTAYGKIYYNGAAVGTERSTAGVIYVTFSEDIHFTNFKVGDKIQLYGYRTGSFVYVQNFRIYGNESPFFGDV